MDNKMNRWKRKGMAVLAAAAVLAGIASTAIHALAADKSALRTAVSQAEQIDVSGYRDETVKLLQSALDSSAQLMNDSSASSLRIKNHAALLQTAVRALVKKNNANAPASGNYTIKGILRQASSDSASMGNESITQPMELVVEDNKFTLRLHFSSLTVPGLGKGYLSGLSYLPDWDGMFLNMTDAQFQAFQACNVEEYYKGVYDLFNDPNTGTDPLIKGKLYPKYITMPVEDQDSEIWVRVYVPIMESISAGGGTQYARLQMDWDTLAWTEPDKEALDAAVEQLVQLQGVAIAADYTQEMVDLLEQAAITGAYVQGSSDIGQNQVDAMAQALNAVANLFADADKSYLYDMIKLAGNYTTSEYKDAYVAKLKKQILAAQEVYNNAFATQTQVNEQYALLLQAISNPQKKKASSAATEPTTTPEPTPTPSPAPTPTTGGENGKLDKENLEDGVYAVTGSMVKIDKSTASMSNDAVNHTIKLTVKKGKYKISMDFMGLNISGRYGYLSKLKYFETGYTLDSYGSPQGTVKAVTVDSYQMDSSGARISDTYGTDYPNQVTFPLISEAVDDGYVPLQVYVPIMEAISAGTGTQPVFLCIDWDTLKSATGDDDFEDNQGSGDSNAGTSGNNLIANSSLTGGNSSLTGWNSSLSGGNASLKRSMAETALLSNAIELGNEGSGMLGEDSGLPEGAGLSSGTMLTETADGEGQALEAGMAPSGSSDHAPNPAAVPTVISVLMAGAGFLFKVKARGGL